MFLGVFGSLVVMINSEPQNYLMATQYRSSSGNSTQPGGYLRLRTSCIHKNRFTNHTMTSLSSKLKKQWHVKQRDQGTRLVTTPTGPPAPTRVRQVCFASKHPDRERHLLVRIIAKVAFISSLVLDLSF
jgi:hypothetical protein